MRRWRSDDGVGLVLVIGVTSALLIIMAVTVTVATNSLTSARRHVSFESSLAAAEAGLDATLGLVQSATDAGENYASIEPCTSQWTWPSSDLPDPASERAWAEAAIAAMPDSCVQDSGDGQYIAFQAESISGAPVPVIYSMGWAPARGVTESAKRLLKTEYLFSPYQPTSALLAGGNLALSGSADVALAASATATSANVHANGNVTLTGNAVQIDGNLTATGTNNAGTCPNGKITGVCSAGTPAQAIPRVSAAAVYASMSRTVAGSWFDLCPDGTVRSPSPPGDEPCSTEDVLSASGSYRGWSRSTVSGVVTWTLNAGGTSYPGVYYAYQSNAVIDGSGKPSVTVSVIAEAAPTGGTAANCSKLGGNITWKNADVTNFLPGLVMLADGSITGSANSSAGIGVLAAGNYVSLSTSSGSVTGSVLASGICPTAGSTSISGTTISFNDATGVPLANVLRTTGWLELSGR